MESESESSEEEIEEIDDEIEEEIEDEVEDEASSVEDEDSDSSSSASENSDSEIDESGSDSESDSNSDSESGSSSDSEEKNYEEDEEEEAENKLNPLAQQSVDSLTNTIAMLEQKKAQIITSNQALNQTITQAVLKTSSDHKCSHDDCGCVPPNTVLIKPELHPESLASLIIPISQHVINTQKLSGIIFDVVKLMKT